MALREDDNIENSLSRLAEWIHANYTVHIPESPNKNFRYNTLRDNGGKISRVHKHANGYTCFFVDQYSIDFSSGRFGPGAKYTREERTLADTRIVNVESTDFRNGSEVEQTETVELTKTHSVSKDIALEVAFRYLVSSNAEASIEFIKAGAKYEYELTTKLNTSKSETKTTESKTTKPIKIPPRTALRYDVLTKLSTYRQRVHAEGLMDFKVNIDIYNVWNRTYDSLYDLENMFNGKADSSDWVHRYFRQYPSKTTIPDQLRDNKLSMTIISEDAKTGETSLTPIPLE